MAEKTTPKNASIWERDVLRWAQGMSAWAKNGTLPPGTAANAAKLLHWHRERVQKKGLVWDCEVAVQEISARSEMKKSRIVRYNAVRKQRWSFARKRAVRFQENGNLSATLDFDRNICGFFWERGAGVDKKKLLSGIWYGIAGGAVVGFLMALYVILWKDISNPVLLLTDSLTGAVAGYVVYTLVQLGKLLAEGIRTVPMAVRSGRTQPQVVAVMERFAQKFSYAAFEMEVIMLLQGVLLAGDIAEVEAYEPDARERCLEDIVDTAYSGMLLFRGYQVDGDCCSFHLDVPMWDTYARHRKIRRRCDLFHLTVFRECGNASDASKQWKIRAMWRD